jgi:anti-sigma regulatory factor (Ser/Thr protein kinase)
MEVIRGSVHTAFPMDDASRVGEARRHAATLARGMDWGELESGRLALVVTELGSNLVRHAHKGQLLLAARPESAEVEVLSIDHGPGIADLAQSMSDGYSTGRTPGTGLGAVRRLSDDFDMQSSRPDGTVAVARVRKPAGSEGGSVSRKGLRLGAICLTAPGEHVSGDAWVACIDGPRAALLVADGLGHGPDAAAAAEAAVDLFTREPFAELESTLSRAHVALQSTRGAAVCALIADAQGNTIRSAGAGNVVTRVVTGVSDRTLLSQHGTVGVQVRKLVAVATEWPAYGLIVVHTDGIETRWKTQRVAPVMSRDPALVAAILVRDHCRHRDDATVVVLRREEQ